jgi:predicted tellurium resistance membrane protein TerC
MEWMTNPHTWIALVTLCLVEIVLGVDNIIFISLVVGRLPPKQREVARIAGLSIALFFRILFLLMITWLIQLSEPLFTILDTEISWKGIILFGGGLFLMAKSTLEIHASLEEANQEHKVGHVYQVMSAVIMQVVIIDIIFSIDSVLTAVGLVKEVEIMIAAVTISVFVMIFASRIIGNIIDTHPSLKMLALSFLILIGFVLMGEGVGMHINKGYIYFAMAFSVGVEVINIKLRTRHAKAVKLRKQLP